MERDLSGLDGEARDAALLSDAPELLSLLAELQDSLGEVRGGGLGGGCLSGWLGELQGWTAGRSGPWALLCRWVP